MSDSDRLGDNDLSKPYVGPIREGEQPSHPIGEPDLPSLPTGEPEEPPVQESHVVEQDVAFTDQRVTHHAMTWQEELAYVEAQEASGVEMTDAEKAHAEQVKETADAHVAFAKAEVEAKAEVAARAKR
jgi:hypothetical protein